MFKPRHTRRDILQGGAAAAASATGMLPVFANAQADTKTVVIAHTTLRHLNPAIQSGQATGMPGVQLFAGLVQADDKFAPQPYLAKAWEIGKDGLSYTFHLVQGATFHDGRPITSDDVAFSLDIVKANHPFGRSMFGPVERVETPDASTVRFILSKPQPAMMSAVVPLLLPILPRHIYSTGPIQTHPANLAPVGSGPFKFKEYKQGEYLILERNPTFFRSGRPYLDRLVFKIMTDPFASVLSVERGEVQYDPFSMVRMRDVDRLSKDPKLLVTRKGYGGFGATNYLEFNLRKKPFDDVRVRKAFAHAIDKDFIVEKLLSGHAVRLDGPLTHDNPFASKDLVTYDYNLERAGALLDEAGHPKGQNGIRFSTTLGWIPDANVSSQAPVAQYLKAQLRKVGIDIDLKPSPDFPTWAARVSNWDHDITMNGIWNYPDPVIGVNRAFLSTNQRKGVIYSNTEGYDNKTVDDLLTAAGQEVDLDRRKALYAKFQKIVTDELPFVWTNEEPLYTLAAKELQNVPMTVWGPIGPYDELRRA